MRNSLSTYFGDISPVKLGHDTPVQRWLRSILAQC